MVNRTKARKQAQKQQNQSRLVLGASLVIVISVIGLVIASGGLGGGGPVATDARQELDPILGDPNAPVTIVEYGAYACTACRAWHQAGIIEDLLTQYPGQVRFIFRDFPVIIPAYDQMAAQLAQCALDQGNDLFWKFHDALYTQARPGLSSQDELISLAGQVGLDASALSACAQDNTHQNTVRYDLERARSLGFRGTPSFLVNDQPIFDATPDRLQQMIEQILSST